MWDKQLEAALKNSAPNLAIVLALLDQGVDPNALDAEGKHTALSWAIVNKRQDIAYGILNHRNYQFTQNTVLALLEALRTGQPVMALSILSKSKPASVSLRHWYIPDTKKTSFWLALENNYVDVVKRMMDLGEDPNEFGPDGKDTALSWAIVNQRYDMAYAILNHRNYQFTQNTVLALLEALRTRQPGMAFSILSKSKPASVSLRHWYIPDTKKTSFWFALENNYVDVVKRMMDLGEDPNELGPDGKQTALSWAIVNQRYDMAYGILNHRNYQFTQNTVLALLEALRTRQPGMALSILSKSKPAAVSLRHWYIPDTKKTSFWLALENNYIDVVKRMMDLGEDPNEFGADGKHTALSWAVVNSKLDLAQAMIGHKNFKFTSTCDWVLTYALQHSLNTIARLLLEKKTGKAVQLNQPTPTIAAVPAPIQQARPEIDLTQAETSSKNALFVQRTALKETGMYQRSYFETSLGKPTLTLWDTKVALMTRKGKIAPALDENGSEPDNVYGKGGRFAL